MNRSIGLRLIEIARPFSGFAQEYAAGRLEEPIASLPKPGTTPATTTRSNHCHRATGLPLWYVSQECELYPERYKQQLGSLPNYTPQVVRHRPRVDVAEGFHQLLQNFSVVRSVPDPSRAGCAFSCSRSGPRTEYELPDRCGLPFFSVASEIFAGWDRFDRPPERKHTSSDYRAYVRVESLLRAG